MDVLTHFTNKLTIGNQDLDQSEKMWDEKAENFYHNQKHGSHYFAEEVPKLLQAKGIVTKSSRVIDIGAGSGRYAVPFAQMAEHIYALDLSQNMLDFIEKEMNLLQLTNFSTLKSAWPLENAPKDIDVAFAAMCPATRTLEGIKAMSEIANKYGVITQFTHSSDNIVDSLVTSGDLVIGKHDPHNNRNMLQAYFNILWELGYEAEISYLHDVFPIALSMKDALASYQKRFDHITAEQIIEALDPFLVNDKFQIEKRTSLAVISWKTN